MKNHFFIFLFLISSNVFSQSYDELIAEADQEYQSKNYQESGTAFDNAFKIKEGTYMHYYNAACSWALAGDTLSASRYLKLSAKKGWKNLKHIENDSDLSSLHGLTSWDEILNEVESNKNEYEKDFNKPLQEQLEYIYVKDQMLRQLYRDAEDKFGRDSDEMKFFWKLVSEQDSINEQEVVNIIDQDGWLGISEVGGKANMAIWLVIQHAPLTLQEKYLPFLKESVLKGESQGNHLALLEDRILMRTGKPQTYGSQLKLDPESGKQVLHEIKDPEYVNQRRKEVGLGPIQDYLRRFGLDWTVEQKER